MAGIVDFLLGLIGFLFLAYQLVKRVFAIRLFPDQVHYVSTDDDWKIGLCRFLPKEAAKGVMVLCHGLGTNWRVFDISPDTSMVRYFLREGFEVWCINLRGHGYSEKPQFWSDKKYDWDFDTFLEHDIPVALEHITKTTNSPKIHWIGLSMGGNLALAALARSHKITKYFASVVTCGSSLDYSSSRTWFFKVLPMLNYVSFLSRLPTHLLNPLWAPFATKFATAFQRFVIYEKNVSREDGCRLFAHIFEPIGMRLLKQLSTHLDSGGIVDRDGNPYSNGMDMNQIPLLALSGDRDVECPPEAVDTTLSTSPAAHTKVIHLGKESGQREHYGHIDLVMGRNVHGEVFPLIKEWVVQHG